MRMRPLAALALILIATPAAAQLARTDAAEARTLARQLRRRSAALLDEAEVSRRRFDTSQEEALRALDSLAGRARWLTLQLDFHRQRPERTAIDLERLLDAYAVAEAALVDLVDYPRAEDDFRELRDVSRELAGLYGLALDGRRLDRRHADRGRDDRGYQRGRDHRRHDDPADDDRRHDDPAGDDRRHDHRADDERRHDHRADDDRRDGDRGAGWGRLEDLDRDAPQPASSSHPDHPRPTSAHPTAAGTEPADPSRTTGLPPGDPRAAATLGSGTTLKIQLRHSLRSRDLHPGDTFVARLAGDVWVGDVRALARGTEIVGRVVEVQLAGKVEGRERMVLTLGSALVDGESLGIAAAPITLEAEGSADRDKKTIAGAAIAGAVLGAIFDKSEAKGAVKGAATGAAAGTGYVLLTRGDSVYLPAGQELEFTLERPLRVPVS